MLNANAGATITKEHPHAIHILKSLREKFMGGRAIKSDEEGEKFSLNELEFRRL